jgi:hypothetical protein
MTSVKADRREGVPVVNFVDRTFVTLGDPATRPDVLDSEALEVILGVAYDPDGLAIEGPFTAVFEDFRMGFTVTPRATLEGAWTSAGGTQRSDALFRIAAAHAHDAPRIDALWRGAIAARGIAGVDRIERVTGAMASLRGIDDEIASALGSLPTDPAALETARRDALLTRLRAHADQPAAISDATLERWLRGTGARSASELLERARGIGHGGTFELTYSAPASGAASPRSFPVTVGLLVRDADVSIAALLGETKIVRERLEQSGLEMPTEPMLRRRQAVVIAWVVPDAVFDDADWPGGGTGTPAAQRALRIRAAQAWLQHEGVALVPRTAA